MLHQHTSNSFRAWERLPRRSWHLPSSTLCIRRCGAISAARSKLVRASCKADKAPLQDEQAAGTQHCLSSGLPALKPVCQLHELVPICQMHYSGFANAVPSTPMSQMTPAQGLHHMAPTEQVFAMTSTCSPQR